MTGGFSGGINAAKDGRRFFDGATVQRKVVDRGLPYVRQVGDYNCGPACAESMSGGGISQSELRNVVSPGSDPNTTGLRDLDMVQKYQSLTGKSADFVRDRALSTIYSEFASGNNILLNTRLPNMNIGHSVLINKAVEKTVTKISGKIITRYLFQVMDPSAAGGQYRPINEKGILNSFNIFKIAH